MQGGQWVNLLRVQPATGKGPFAKQTGISTNVMNKQNLFIFHQYGSDGVRTARSMICDF